MPERMGLGPIIRTKLQRPRLPGDLIRRPRLLDRLHDGLQRKLILISAMAGTGKTTLLAQWLEECSPPSAWLSLDEHDNDPILFLSYLCAAIRTVFPSACGNALSLLRVSPTPSARVITSLIINELDQLIADRSRDGDSSTAGLILALDDYYRITQPTTHDIVSGLIEHLPRGMHLALATRIDPPFPLAGLRARGEMTEVRTADLRFTSEETHAFLEGIIGTELNPETIRLLQNKTEGWIVGLRLASLSLRNLLGDGALVQRFDGADSALVVEYLVSEVLDRQSQEIQDFVLRTSVLDRFCAPLCQELTGVSAARSQEIIEWIARSNLFLVPLGEVGGWYRYHHLFREFLRHTLGQRASAADIAGLHTCAGTWLARKGLIDEALHHFLAAGDTVSAVALVARERYALMNRAHWARIGQYLSEFSADAASQSPELLMLRTWLLYQQGRYAELPTALQEIETASAHASLSTEAAESLRGEICTLRSLNSCLAVDVEGALAHGQEALAKTPRELWIVRVAARLYLAGGRLMMGDRNGAYETVYAGFEEEGDGSNAFKATLLTTACILHWMTADLPGLAQAAERVLVLSRDPYSPQFLAWGHHYLGRVRYHEDNLASAEEHFSAVVQQPYLSYGDCYIYSACGLALTYQAMGRTNQAREAAEAGVAYALETGNTTLLPVALAFQVELALRQGHIAAAGQQAARFDPVPPFSPMFGLFAPHLTLVKVWLAQDTPSSREKAAELLDRVIAFCESTDTPRFLIEALALRALLHDMEGKALAAMDDLERAVVLAEPSGFIRLFVDLGRALARLLARLHRRHVAVDYIRRILTAFEARDAGPPTAVVVPSPLIEPLTPRELEVLALLDRHLTNKEIAAELVISPGTVKTHTLNIYRKLDVQERREAAARAKTLNLL